MKKTLELFGDGFLKLTEAVCRIILSVIYMFFYTIEQVSSVAASWIKKKL